MILWILYIFVDALINWFIIEKKKINPNHIMLTIFRGWAFIGLGIALDIKPDEILEWFIFCAGSFWVLFDPILNKLRGKALTYVGKLGDEGGDSESEKFGVKNPKLYWISKALALVAVIVTLFI